MTDESSVYALQRATVSRTLTDSEFVRLLHDYEDVLYRVAFMHLRNEHDALEAVSEAVYRAYKDKSSLKDVDYFQTWVTRIVINACLNQLKGRKRTQTVPEDYFDRDVTWDQASEAEQRFALDDAVARLKPAYKTVVLLRYYQEMSVKETAAVMGKGENTIKTMTRRALAELRKILGKDISYE